MTGRRLGLATLIVTLLAAPAGADAATFTQEGLPYTVGVDPYGVVARDFNGDGLVDVATVNGSSSNVSVFMRQPTGGFSQEGTPILTGGSGPNFAATADFNADGLPDLAVSNYSSGNISILLRQAGGGFVLEGATTVPVAGSSTSVVTGNFNGDTLPDLAATSDNGFVTILLRQPNGSFASSSYGANPTPRNLSVGDLDGDGDQDLAIANDFTGGGVTTLYNNGAANFSAGSEFIATGTRTFGTAIADFNGDGRNDIAATNLGDSTVSRVLRNAANTGFDAPTSSAVSGGPIGLTVADFDANGTRDLAVASNNAGTVTILTGATAAEPPMTLPRAYGVAAADFNNDGKMDLAATGDTTNSFSVLLNTTPSAQPPPVSTPTPTPTPTVAPPVAGRSVNADPVSGKVKVKLPGSNRFVDLSEAANLPVGTTVDTRDGRVTLTAAGKGGEADFFDGLFKISQTRGSKPLTTLTLTETLSCPKKGKAASAAAKKKTRKLWGDGKGSFRTSGKYAAATVRGTKWLVTDYCDRTTTRVTQGVVIVRDKVKKRNITVRKGKSYTARAKK